MAKYRKKPVVIEAHRWFRNGDHPKDDVMRPFEDTGDIPKEPREGAVVRYYRTPKLDGQDVCNRCNQIMHYHDPCKPDIFETTYDLVED